MIICLLVLLLEEGRAGEDRETLNEGMLLWKSGSTGQKNNFNFFDTFIPSTYTISSFVRLPQRYSRFKASGDLTITFPNTQASDHCSGFELQ